MKSPTLTGALVGALSVTIGMNLPKVARWVHTGRARHHDRGREINDAMAALDDALLRARFAELAPEFRLTHAGAGRPPEARDEEIDALMELGLVECVPRPHVAAGMLTIFKLTSLGDAVARRAAREESRRFRRPLLGRIPVSSG